MKTKINLSERVKQSKTGKQLVYVLECIENSSYATDEGKTFANDYEKISFFFNCFNNEFNYIQNRKRFPNLQTRIKEYIAGLPSCFNLVYTWNDIVTIGKSWGYCTTEKKEENFVYNWFNILSLRLLQTAAKVGYNTSNLH